MTQAPRVFISHASQDKSRFVVPFAERLRAKGIDAWLDKWEMLPGDSLVDKIFNEGLKPSDAVIVVLSDVSIRKPWVQKEMNTAVVKNIEDKTRLIPVRLDGCEIPECLRDRLYQSIHDLAQYDSDFDRIVSAIFGELDKPKLGSRPAYADIEVLQVGDLCRNDSLFLSEACRVLLAQGHPSVLNPEAFESTLTGMGVAKEQILEAQDVLSNRGYIRISPTIGPPQLPVFRVRTAGLRLFAEAGGIPDYGKKIEDVARMIVDRVLIHGGMVQNTSIENHLEMPAMLVEHILERLRDIGQIKYQEEIGGRLYMTVYWASPELRRKLEGHR